MIVDVRSLAGRHYVSAHGNVAVLAVIGMGGLRATWKQIATDEDISELENWVGSLLNADVTTNRGLKTEAAAYSAFKQAKG